MPVNDQLAEDAVDHGIEIARITKALELEVAALIEDLAENLRTILKSSGVGSKSLPPRELRGIEAQAAVAIDAAFDKISALTERTMADVAKLTQTMSLSSMQTHIGLDGKPITQAELDALAQDRVVLGNRMSEWWQGQRKSTKERFISQLRQGLLNNEDNDALIARIVGMPITGTRVVMRNGERVRVPLRSGGILTLSELQADALVRTSVNSIANETLTRIYEQNQDVLKGVAVVVTLDTRTSLICIALYGGAWDFDGNPLPESGVNMPYPGQPPYHMRCRTVLAPVTKSWAELGAAVQVTIPPGTKASMDGQVPAKMTFDQWLRRKPESTQKEMLGAGRWKLWKDGKIQMSQFIDHRLRPRSLSQLQRIAEKT